jgi:hypothetical protein
MRKLKQPVKFSKIISLRERQAKLRLGGGAPLPLPVQNPT